ncbi:Fungalysin metallopeptidase-domain-containing protein [Trametes punicea]|nr:Fungalysin metallopeptidase-domain-containing protein [Trametes punicea]
MLVLRRIFASVLLAMLWATIVTAAPYPASSKFATHRTHELGEGVKIESYHPPSSYEYVTKDPAGFRSHPYSTSASVNRPRYSSVQQLTEVHAIGEVWANMLHNVYAALVEAHGFSSTARTDPTGTEGNIVFLHLFIDALPLQPCDPTFVTARDAWIQADQNRYRGANNCLLWRAFASRGLGVNAQNFNDDSTVPSGC